MMAPRKSIQSFLVVGFLVTATLIVQSPSIAAPNLAPPTQSPCYKPQSVTTEISGYVEGHTGNKNTTITGKEIVYNFVTFQRKTYSFKTQITTSGEDLGSYVGYVQGFVTNQSAPNDTTTFDNQYATPTQFVLISQPADAPIWTGFNALAGRQGTVHFATATDVTPQPIAPVSGDQAYLDVSNPPFFVGESGRSGYFASNGNTKSYIVNCLVDIASLMSDIQTGDGSTAFKRSQSGLVSPWRNAATSAAQFAAQDYNHRVQTQTG